MHTKFYKITPAHVGERLDSYLASLPEMPTRSQIQKMIQEIHIRVNGFETKPNYHIKEQDTICVDELSVRPSEMKPQALPLFILYEDQDIVVIDKAAGMVVHPGAGNREGTVVNALLHHCKNLSGVGGVHRPGVVHRLDKETSGVMVFAKNDEAHLSLSAQFKERTIQRRYLTLVFGRMGKTQGMFDQAIGRHPSQRKKMSSKSKHGKTALTHWEVKKEYDQLSLMSIKLMTGRTHQVRVHFSEAGHPVVGDDVYGGVKRTHQIVSLDVKNAIEKVSHLLLHAEFLSFKHPRTHETLTFQTPLPSYFKEVLDLLDDEDR